MVPKGEWSATTAYTRLDVVLYQGSAWVCIKDGTGQEPASGSTYWQLLAAGITASDYYTKSDVDGIVTDAEAWMREQLAGKQDTLVSGTNIKTINGTSVLGSGNVTVPAGEDGKSAYQSYLDTTTDVPPKTEAEWVASLKGEDGAPGAPGADGVDLGEVALVQSNGMNADKVMSQKAVTENYIELSDYYYQVIRKAYSTVNYTAGTLNNSGEVASGPAYVTNFLPVVGGEAIHLNKTTTEKVAYYDAQSAFISIVTVGSGMSSYVVPANAAYARFQVAYSGGATPLLGIREKTFANKSFYDLIASPIKTTISIGFTGDSNTVGYGLASGEKSWANLLGDAIVANFATKRYGFNSPWVESMGFSPYSGTANFKTGSQMSIYTDAETITLAIPEKYSAAWKWQIDGVDSGTTSSNSLTTDGALHKITVVFTAGQSVNPCFVINKTITYTNDAQTGVGIGNMPFNTGYDWYFVMIGTNNRGSTTANYLPQLQLKFAQQYFGKGTYVVPFPNHKSDSSYIYSQMLIYSQFAELFKEAGWDVINLAAINADAFYTNDNYQSDKIHYNATGHRIIANMVSGTLGFPLYLQG